MSRGLGKVQRQILEFLERNGKADLSTLIEHIYGVGHYGVMGKYEGAQAEDKKEYVTVSRAVSRLEKLGYVKKSIDYEEGITRHSEIFGYVVVELVKR